MSMLAVYPTELPVLRVPGASGQRVDANERSDPSEGPPVVRRVSLDVPMRLNGRLTMTGAQFGRFEGFEQYVLRNGAEPFVMPIRFAGGVRSVTAQFTGPYEWSEQGPDLVEVTAPLLLLGHVGQAFGGELAHDAVAPAYMGTTPAIHKVTAVDFHVYEGVDAGTSAVVNVGYQGSTPADELVDALDVMTPGSVTVEVGDAEAGLQLGQQRTVAKTLVAELVTTGTAPTVGVVVAVARLGQ